MKAVFEAHAARDLRRLEPPIVARIVQAIERLAETGSGEIRRLQGAYAGSLRLRVGDYRVIFRREPPGVVRVLRILHRSGAYGD
jgi:mRNA interferase RelE/StbE